MRVLWRVMLPLCFVMALVYVWQGMPQTLASDVVATTLEGAQQQIILGPVASFETIKHIGTNGGGFFSMNAAHPFENPTPLSNVLHILSMLLIPSALTVTFGLMLARRKQGWVFFGAFLVMFIGFAGAAYYIDYRLTSLESKVLTQAGDVSKQTEDTLQAIQNARKDILGNRAESAEFAQKFSTTLTDMSALVTESVQAFTQQTSKLTQAIESQDQNQRDFLQVLASNLTQEAAATREAVREAHGQSQAVERHVAALARQVEQNSQEMQDGLRQLGQEFASGFTSMSEWSQQMNTVLSSRLDEQARILNQHLSALREDSQRSLNRIESYLAVINTETQTGRSMLETIASEGLAQLEGKLAGYAEDLRNETHGVETTLANQVDTLVDTLRAGLLEQKGAISDLHSLIGDQTQALAEELQLGFAGGKESVEILRDDMQEMEYALHGRTEDLWLEVAALKQAQDQTAERTAVAVTTGLQSLSQAIAGLESAVEDTRSLTASSRELIEQWTSRESRRDQDFAAALEILTQTRLAMESTNVQLGNLGQRVDTIHGDLVTQLETVRQA